LRPSTEREEPEDEVNQGAILIACIGGGDFLFDMGKLTFITGGARSGKSSFALKEAERAGGRRLFVATLEARDEEMKKRVERHVRERGDGWDTIEEPVYVAALLREASSVYDAAVLDCLTLWLSNVMHVGRNAEEDGDALVNALSQAKADVDIYVVSNEVGMGIVPVGEVAREFRDLAGTLNQKVARAADEVYMMASGIPVKIKGEGA
jgi:adenosylcobinamide kinase/adenosylcobinamide-phosphate guanylyltransferase